MKKFIIPIVLFVFIGVLLWRGLSLDPKKIPSPLIGKPLPDFSLTRVGDDKATIKKADLLGQVYFLNVWASWCVACRQEHPLLVEIKKRDLVPLIGLNYKDTRNDALGFLSALGNPYSMSIFDPKGRLGIDLGVYGVPETFVIDKKGVIRFKQIGPVNQDVLMKDMLPLVELLRKEP